MMRSNAPTPTIPNADTRSICHSVGPRVIDSEESVAEPNRGTQAGTTRALLVGVRVEDHDASSGLVVWL